MKRLEWIAAGAVAAIVTLGAFVTAARVNDRNAQLEEMTQLGRRHQELRDSLQAMIANDPMIELAEAGSPGIAVAIEDTLLVDVIEEAAERYLDRIEIDLATEFGGHGEGDLETKTPLGEMTLGEWRVVVTVHEMKAVLSTLRPTVSVTDSNRLDVELPVRIAGGRGAITLDFWWDSKSIFNVVCADWSSRQRIEGAILPRSYRVRGELVLAAGAHGIVADPDFPPDRFPLAMEVDRESWERIRQVLEEQDKLHKCGLLVNPEDILAKLQAMGFKGLSFRLPRTVFRSIALPARLTQTVRILDSSVEIAVATDTLRISPGLMWYAADIEARRSSKPAVPLPLPSNVR